MAKEPKPADEMTAEERMIAFQERQLAIQERQLALQEQSQGVQKEQLRQTRRRSNQAGALRSPFNPRGDKDFPMPDLKCEMWVPFKLSDPHTGGLDREEVELLNLLEPGEYTIEMNDGAAQIVCVIGTRNTETGKLYKLAMVGPRDEDGKHTGLFTKERRQQFPSLKSMLRQIIGQDGTASVMTMREEVRRIHLPVDDPNHLTVSIGE